MLVMKNISKAFNGMNALANVNLVLKRGEVLALVGENGAGKSTLMKILAGIHEPDEGEILLDGKQVKIHSPTSSQKLGIGIIHQELNLISHMTVAENVFLGREPRKLGIFTDKENMVAETRQLLESFHLDLDPNAKIHSLSIGQQQIVEIVKALSLDASILIMDEPTAVLEERESARLFELIRKFKERGTSIIYISHRLNELRLFCDTVTVMRDGQHVTTLPMSELTERSIANLMVGRELNELFPSKASKFGEEVLKVENLSLKPYFDNVNFSIRKGEVVGFSGLVGAGRTELARTLFGDWKPDTGRVYWKGKQVHLRNPVDAVALGFGFATEDRKQSGLFLDMSIAQNITIAVPKKVSKWQVINRKTEDQTVDRKVKELNIKVNKVTQPVKSLSGGNQQKVVIAKWLATDCELFILDEPTRGIDVGAKSEIYHLISQFAAEGKAVIVISSELPELLGLCNRILVMHRGTIHGELDHTEANEQKIMALAAGIAEGM
ncbi:sugar ABC transporter ATP-binding protein [Paenibacillus sp. P36]|uniref:sugar ABC transporter ATP-binding protein n=1 Tax=Paenibacillus sp. P36 TaxID=3342538 RepID=UPI0038B3528E